MAFVKRNKSPSPSKCNESSDGNGEGMMNMVRHTRNQNEPNVVTLVRTLGVHGVITSSKQHMARDARGLGYFFLFLLNILWLEFPNIVVTLTFWLSLTINIYVGFGLICDFARKLQIKQTPIVEVQPIVAQIPIPHVENYPTTPQNPRAYVRCGLSISLMAIHARHAYNWLSMAST